MKSFIQRHAASVMGVLNGFDRIRFRGTLRCLNYASGFGKYLHAIGVRLTDFKAFSQGVTERLCKSVEGMAQAAGRPSEYMASALISKEDHVRRIARRDGIEEGLVAVLRAVEPCRSYRIGREPSHGYLQLHKTTSKCLHYYAYWLDRSWGLCHVRMQTWFPLSVHICMNGREWLARQMDAAGIGYQRRENCFVWVQDMPRAQALLDRQLKTNWSRALNGLLRRSHPAGHAGFSEMARDGYYWSVDESEWASDVMFTSAQRLAGLYGPLLEHALRTLGSREVLRFLGRRIPAQGRVPAGFAGQVVSDLRERPEGMRIKHRLNTNSIKMYNKQGSVLRVETTLNDTRDFRVFRSKEGHPDEPPAWHILRKGVADMHWRAEISQKANERYLEALAAVEEKTPLGKLTEKLCRPVRWKQGRVRALQPWAGSDARLLEAVSRGEFVINGFRNRDLRALLCPDSNDPALQKKQSTSITRQLRLLRAHGLIRKVSRTHRYVLTEKGRTVITALLVARSADTKKLAELVA